MTGLRAAAAHQVEAQETRAEKKQGCRYGDSDSSRNCNRHRRGTSVVTNRIGREIVVEAKPKLPSSPDLDYGYRRVAYDEQSWIVLWDDAWRTCIQIQGRITDKSDQLAVLLIGNPLIAPSTG